MTIQAQTNMENGSITIHIHGDLTYESFPDLEQAVDQRAESDLLTLDFQELDFIDAEVLNSLEPLLTRIRNGGRRIKIVSSSEVLSAF